MEGNKKQYPVRAAANPFTTFLLTKTVSLCILAKSSNTMTNIAAEEQAGLQQMNVGVCQIELRLPENESLKGKRRVVKSIIARLQNTYGVSVAEIANQELWQIATLGITCVSNRRRHADEILASVIKFVAQNYPDLEMLSSKVEVFPAF